MSDLVSPSPTWTCFAAFPVYKEVTLLAFLAAGSQGGGGHDRTIQTALGTFVTRVVMENLSFFANRTFLSLSGTLHTTSITLEAFVIF